MSFRSAVRSLARHPGFTLVAALTSALGIGAVAAVFSLLDAAFLRPLPYPHADRLAVIATMRKQDEISDAYPDLLDWRAQNHSFQAIAGFAGNSVSVTDGAADVEPERVRGQLITPNLFRTLGVRPQIGRDFTDAEAQWGTSRTVILGYNLWRRRYAQDPAIVGRIISLDRESYTVVGVMPEGFDFPGGITYGPAEVWMPSGLAGQQDWETRGSHPGLMAIGRLRDGVSMSAARADMDRIAANLRVAYPADNQDEGIKLRGALESIVGDIAPGLRLVSVAVAIFLLITSANVAGLLFARGVARQREIAIRTALGATRAKLLLELLAESLMLGLIGGALGLALAWATVHAMSALFAGLPRLANVRLDWPVMGFAMTLSALTGVAFGIGPAVSATGRRVDVWLRERAGAGTAATTRARGVLIVGEIALSLVLVVAATLLGRSFAKLQAEQGGIDASGVLTFELRLPSSPYSDASQVTGFYHTLFERIRELPGVTAAAGISTLPFSGSGAQSGMQAVGGDDESVRTDVATVTPDYFRAMGVQLLRGSLFQGTVGDSSMQSVVVDERLAKHFWPGADPVGKQLRGWGFDALTVVGVVRHVANYGVAAESRQELFVSYALRPNNHMVGVVRTNGAPEVLTPLVRKIIAEMDRQLPVYNVQTMRNIVGSTVAAPRLAASLSGAFATLALLLTAVGLYGLLAFIVGQRRREIGIRMALGAMPATVVGSIVGRGLRLASTGIALGLLGAWGATRLLRHQLFGVKSNDLAAFVIGPVIFLGVAAFASWIPALRASKVPPVEALRSD